MKRIKSTPEDESILIDETADSPDRLSSMQKLAFDGFGKQIHPILDKWLNHSEFILRDGAISMLLGNWGHRKYVDKAIEMMHQDEDWSVRIGAARALKKFCMDFIEGKSYEDQIIKELLLALIQDQDVFVQKTAYQELRSVINDESRTFYDEKDYFDKEVDVDWKRLQPYLDRYDLQKPF